MKKDMKKEKKSFEPPVVRLIHLGNDVIITSGDGPVSAYIGYGITPGTDVSWET